MKYILEYSDQARTDLGDVWKYIAQGLNNEPAADRITASIQKAANRLTSFSEMGASLNTISTTESLYRFLVCGKYLIFYRIEGEIIRIDRIFYGKRDYLSELFNENTTGGE